MLHLNRLSCQQQISPEIRELILQETAYQTLDLPDNILAKYYSWHKTAQWLCTEAPANLMYALYEDTEPIGVMCFSETTTAHLDCQCFVEDLIFISKDKRSLKALLFLIKSTLAAIKAEYHSGLVFVGSTLSSSSLPAIYKRLGFVEAGTHLVLEL